MITLDYWDKTHICVKSWPSIKLVAQLIYIIVKYIVIFGFELKRDEMEISFLSISLFHFNSDERG